MAEYLVPVDIANRALDFCGDSPIVAFTDNSKRARVVSQIYDKARTAELRRNVWTHSIKKVALRAVDNTTMFIEPPAYNPGGTYPQGSIVTYQNETYISQLYVPVNTPPGTPNEAFWTIYFGPLTASPWNPTPPTNFNIPQWSSTVTYNDGDYVTGSDNLVYVCVVGTSLNNNPVGDNGVHWVFTGTAAGGSAPPTYYPGELVYNIKSPGVVQVFQCQTTNTLDNPTSPPDLWLASVTYNTGDTVTDSNNVIWQSQIDLNVGNTPAAGLLWEAVPAGQVDTLVGQNWLQINTGLVYKRILYPIGSGPLNQTTTRNVYKLPNGFLRLAPQDPKAGATSYLGAPSGLAYSDWEIEDGYIVTRDTAVLIVRFAADVADVTQFDPLFCEGLAAAIGLKAITSLDGTGKAQIIASEYDKFMAEAREVNAIEAGADEPPLDDWIQCRY